MSIIGDNIKLDFFKCRKYIDYHFALREEYPYSEFFWSVFSCIWTVPYSVRMRENTDQKNSEYGNFSHRVKQ